MKKTFCPPLIILFLTISFSCNKCNKENARTKDVEIAADSVVSVKIHRYEKDLFAVDINDLKNGLKKLLPEYAFFIPDSMIGKTTSIQQIKDFLTDPLIIALFHDCREIFPDVKDLETQLSKALTYYKHYYPERKVPKVFTCVSGLDYEEPVRYADSVLIISLDMYMGKNYKYYTDVLAARYSVPAYLQRRFSKEYIMTDCMRAMAATLIDNSQQGNKFIDYIVYEGKILYFLDAMLPDTPDSLKIYYTSQQMDWCTRNEANVWSYIIDQKLLYTSSTNLISKLCADGPFTSIFSKQSPPRVGIWVGWRIVRSYMENNPKVTLKELFVDQDAQEILTKAKYKPKK